MNKFSEIAKDDIHLAGDKLSLPDIVGKQIIVTGYKITKSKFKEDNYTAIQFELDGEQHVTFTGATILIEPLNITNQLINYTR
jgi:hypothetical protein